MPEQPNDMRSEKQKVSPNLPENKIDKKPNPKTGMKSESDDKDSSCGTSGTCGTGSCS